MNLRDELMKIAVHLEAGNVVDRDRVTDLLRRAAGTMGELRGTMPLDKLDGDPRWLADLKRRAGREESNKTWCPCCKAHCPDVERRRLNTAYPRDESNFLTSCGNCHRDAVDYYTELWDEYHSTVG